MDKDRHTVAAREGACRLQIGLRKSVNRVRRHRRSDERIISPFVDELLRVFEGLGGRPMIGCGKIDDGLAENAAHPGLFGDAGDRILEVVHIRIGRDAAADHLDQAQPRSPLDKVFGHVLRFGGEDIFLEPVVEGMVVSKATEQAHGRVRMAVYESGEDQRAAGVDRSTGAMARFDIGSPADRHN